MARLTSFGLENFRTFKQQTTFELAPLTILTGPNGSGKSTLLQAMLLLQESARQRRLRSLVFEGATGRIGSYAKALSHGASAPITFTLGFDGSVCKLLPGPNGRPIGFEKTRKALRESEADWIPFEPEWSLPDQVLVSLRYGEPRSAEDTALPREEELKSIVIESVDGPARSVLFEAVVQEEWFSPPDEEWTGPGPGPPLGGTWTQWTLNGQWFYQRFGGTHEKVAELLELELNAQTSALFDFLDGRIERERFGPESKGFIDLDTLHTFAAEYLFRTSNARYKEHDGWSGDRALDEQIQNFLLNTVGGLIRILVRALFEKLAGVEFNGTFRAPLRRVFLPDNTDEGFMRLLRACEQATGRQAEDARLLQFFGIGEALKVEKVAEDAYTASVRRGDRFMPVSDLGYGHVQLLPLILHTVGMGSRQATLLLEEPEANLHPNLQSRLADLFMELVSKDQVGHGWPADVSKNLIVETHSEYLIRRLQYLVASGKADPGQIAIYYLGTEPEAEDHVRRITIAENGQLSQEFGPGFLDEASNLMIDLYKYGSQN